MAYSERTARKYCKDPIEWIENEQIARASTEEYDIHHRLEIDLGVSRQWLKDHDLYYHRPASELIFLTHDEHQRIHKLGKLNPQYGKPLSEEHRKKISASGTGQKRSAEARKNMSIAQKKIIAERRRSYIGTCNPFYGKYHTEETIESISGQNNHCYNHVCPALLFCLRHFQKMSIKKIAPIVGIGKTAVWRKLKDLSLL